MSKQTDHQLRIENFMDLAKQDLPRGPTMPSKEVRLLRARLIMEEALETIAALGFTPSLNLKGFTASILMDSVEFWGDKEPDFEGIVDGCADLSVVTIGTLSACGVEDGPVLVEVDRSNLTKFRDGYRIREDGKLIKSPLYEPAKYACVEESNGKGA